MKSSEPASEDLERLIGSTAGGKYRVERLIGRGGMGAVFQATNVAIGKRVALKFLNREAAQDRDRALRFQREAQAAGMIESEHIVQVFDAGTSDDGLPFLVMELLQGEDLRARLRREGALAVPDTVTITQQVLRALVRAHAAGIVHRDLKPDNVFLCTRDDGSLLVKLVDFGISKLSRGSKFERLTRRGTVLGSAYYMSPEQAQASDDVDQRADIFGVGAMSFEMLASRPPHLGRTLEAVLVAICTQDAPDVRDLRPDTPPELAEAVARALSREREARFASASEFLEALAPPGGFSRSRRRRKAVPRTLVAGVLATLLGFTLTALLVSRRAPPSPDPSPSGAREERPLANAASAPTTSPPPAAPQVLPLASVKASALPASTASTTAARKSGHPAPGTGGARPAERRPKPGHAGSGVANSLQLSTREP
ncbi:MAG TPA: serine/threonine-protein kinase [Polyangiaceae bacterium]